jgi:hypothetical protein
MMRKKEIEMEMDIERVRTGDTAEGIWRQKDKDMHSRMKNSC